MFGVSVYTYLYLSHAVRLSTLACIAPHTWRCTKLHLLRAAAVHVLRPTNSVFALSLILRVCCWTLVNISANTETLTKLFLWSAGRSNNNKQVLVLCLRASIRGVVKFYLMREFSTDLFFIVYRSRDDDRSNWA